MFDKALFVSFLFGVWNVLELGTIQALFGRILGEYGPKAHIKRWHNNKEKLDDD